MQEDFKYTHLKIKISENIIVYLINDFETLHILIVIFC